MELFRAAHVLFYFVVTRLVSGFSTIPFNTSSRNRIDQAAIAFPLSIRQRATSCEDNDAQQDSNNDEAERMKAKAQELREQIRKMEDQLGDSRKRNYDPPPPSSAAKEAVTTSLTNKRILVTGANGRLGSRVCRYLLRNYPDTQVVACVHYIGENSPTSRGFGRLSYEVGAEDGLGSIGAAWSAEDRTATFEYDASVMEGYNLQNLRLVECELLDPVQCRTIVEGCDSVIWCATDFDGNSPRAVGSLDFALLFRAVSRPDKGRVEVEGLTNMLGALKMEKQEGRNKNGDGGPTDFVHVSVAPKMFVNSETPFGSFWGIKYQSEQVALQDFPSLTTAVLQFGAYDDNFVEEDLPLQYEKTIELAEGEDPPLRHINRRDAARAAVEALLMKDLVGETTQVWTQSSTNS